MEAHGEIITVAVELEPLFESGITHEGSKTRFLCQYLSLRTRILLRNRFFWLSPRSVVEVC